MCIHVYIYMNMYIYTNILLFIYIDIYIYLFAGGAMTGEQGLGDSSRLTHDSFMCSSSPIHV